MASKNDDAYVHMDTETVENPHSATSKCKNFMSQFFLFLIVCGLLFLLICQIITMSAVSENQVEAAQAK